MQLYNYNIVLLLKRLLLAAFLFFIGRLFFYIYNFGLFADIELWQLIKIFFFGFRFDLSAIIYFNFLFIILHLLPLGKFVLRLSVQVFLKLYFIIVNSTLVLVNLVDSIYFHFVQKRSTADIFKFIFVSDDVPTLLPGFIRDYWFVVVIWFIIIALSWMIYPKLNKQKFTIILNSANKGKKRLLLAYKLIIMVLLLGLSLISARGGLQLKPLSIIDASKNVKVSHMPLVLNSVFTIMTTYGYEGLIEKKYFTQEQCKDNYNIVHNFKDEKKSFINKNIVVLLLESFSKEYVGSLNNYEGFTPFLDSLMQHSFVMEDAYSNGLRSIDAIPAIVTGTPALMDDPFITSVYSTNPTNSLAVILKDKHIFFKFDYISVSINFIIILIISMLTAYFPARKAAKLSSAEALRSYE